MAGNAGALVDLSSADGLGRYRRGRRDPNGLPRTFRRRNIDLVHGFNPLGHARFGVRQRVAVLSNSLGSVEMMGHEYENEQHQYRVEPKKNPEVFRVALFSH